MIEESPYLLVGAEINDSTILAWDGERLDASGCNRVYQLVLRHLSTLEEWSRHDSSLLPLDGASYPEDHRRQLELNWLCRICVRGLVILADHQYPVADHVSAVFYNLGCVKLKQRDTIFAAPSSTEIERQEAILLGRIALRETFLLGHGTIRAIKLRYDELLAHLPPSGLNDREKEEFVARFLHRGVSVVKFEDENIGGADALSSNDRAVLKLLDACFPHREVCIVLHNYAAYWRDLGQLDLLRALRSGKHAFGQPSLEAVETSNLRTVEDFQRLFALRGWPLPK
ncbi:hypothetical protein KBB08_03705 [Candidatus Gracilibacteria bacterium]|nr:hypothetical protein [Candidatus Gracilibacteria bacterium]